MELLETIIKVNAPEDEVAVHLIMTTYDGKAEL